MNRQICIVGFEELYVAWEKGINKIHCNIKTVFDVAAVSFAASRTLFWLELSSRCLRAIRMLVNLLPDSMGNISL